MPKDNLERAIKKGAGGMEGVTYDETPAECIVREMLEEIEVNTEGCELFRIYEFADRTEVYGKSEGLQGGRKRTLSNQ